MKTSEREWAPLFFLAAIVVFIATMIFCGPNFREDCRDAGGVWIHKHCLDIQEIEYE